MRRSGHHNTHASRWRPPIAARKSLAWLRHLGLCLLTLAALVLSPTQQGGADSAVTAPRELVGHKNEVFAVVFSENGQLLASAGGDQLIRLWDPATGRALKELRGHHGAVHTLAFSPDGRTLASGGKDGTIRFWDIPGGIERNTISTTFGGVRALAYAPDGRLLASGGDDGSVRFWNLETKKVQRAVRGSFGISYGMRFTADGRQLATANSDGKVHLWEVSTGLQRATLAGSIGAVRDAAFSPDGRWVAGAGNDGDIRLWDAGSGEEHLRLSGHRGEVYAIEFSRDGRSLVSGGADGTIRVWDVATGRERFALAGHKGPVWSVTISPDGLVVASGGRDRMVRVQPSMPVALSASLADKIKQHGDEIGAPPSPPPLPEAELALSPVEVKAGGTLTLKLTVTNKGKGPLYRMQATTKSSDTLFNGHRFYLGKIDAGHASTDSLMLRVPSDRPDGEAPFELLYEEYNGFVPPPTQAVVSLKGLPRPRFAYTYQVVDDGSGQSVGNGDGRVQTGEAVDLLLTIKNVGAVLAQNTTVELTPPHTPGLRLDRSTLSFGPLQPEQTKSVRVNLFVPHDQKEPEIPLRLLIRERSMNVFLDDTVGLQVDHRPPPAITVLNKRVLVSKPSVTIYSGAGVETPVLASATQGQSLAISGELGEWYRVQISESERGWIPRSQVAEAAEPPPGEMPVPVVVSAPVVKLFQKAPPVIALAGIVDNAEVSADRIFLSGAVASERGVAKLEIRVNDQLVTQRGGRGVAVVPDDPGPTTNFNFAERVPLQEGKNVILVTAVDHDNLSASRTLRVNRTVDRGKIWAVVVGISRYKAVQPLRYADRDAMAFQEYVTEHLGVTKDRLMLLLNEEATLTNLKRTLGTELKRKAGEKDTVLIYYAGHGAPEADASSADEDGLEKYIVPYDADPKDLYTTGLPMREVETIFNRLAPERVIFISDSCYSGATAGRTFATASRRAVVSDAFMTRLSKGKGRVVLSASKASEISEEREDLGHGVFTYYFLEGLKGKADGDGDGMVTVDEVYAYVSKKVPEVTGQNQHPVRKGEVEGQLVLGQVR